MTTLTAAQLRNVRSLDDVLTFLHDELDWPIDADDLEEATFDWDPSELNLPPDRVPHLATLRQLRPLEDNQPWGIFFVEFDGPRLPLTALRRLLDRLVSKKRAAGGGTLRTWRLDNLLFVVTTSSGDTVELHFLAFFEPAGKPVEIRSLPWRPTQSPSQHLQRLATELLPKLSWPDDPAAAQTWRDAWRDAFQLRHGEAIKSASTLAVRMADTARSLRSEIAAALAAEKATGPFTTLLAEVKRQLVSGVTPETFADMCAQTLVYGLLSSRISDPVAFGASPVLAVVPLSNPFLAAFFDDVYDQASVLDLDGIGLDQLVADLRVSKVEAILDQFGSSVAGGDPVVHFYEEFLQRYDRRMRADAGAFYTPQPVVEFMVRTVDSLLRARFGLELGVADGSSWAQVSKRNGFEVPDGVAPSASFVSMIDPATGTGTFLVEWLRRARASFLTTHTQAEWATYARDVVLPMMHGFELMLGPYAIAHLKTALELHDEDIGDAAPMIVLTDTLDHDAQQMTFANDDPVSREVQRAFDLKDGARFTVCIGNPPYDREQRAADSALGKRKGGVARFGAPGVKPLMDHILDPLKAAGLGKHAKNAYNDYAYFWCWAIWQAITKRPGPGVVAFITASSYLDGPSFAGLRSYMRDVFDELWIVDLGGEGRGARVDENVFAIRTPVAIAFGVRNGQQKPDCVVRQLSVAGTRAEKLQQLCDLDLFASATQLIPGAGLDRLTPKTDAAYHNYIDITELFPWIYSGAQLKRVWPIGPSRSVIARRWEHLLSVAPSKRRELMRETADRNLTSRVESFLASRILKPISSLNAGAEPDGFVRYGYRSFDMQWVIADNRLSDRPRPPLWHVRGNHQLYLATLTSTKLGKGPAVTASPYVPDLDFFSGRGAKNVMPLYVDRRGAHPNVPAELLEVLSSQIGNTISVEDLAAYVYALTGTAAFGERFADELGEGAGPVRIPLTGSKRLFAKVAALGKELLWWHTWGERFAVDDSNLPCGRAREIQPVRAYPEKASWDRASRKITIGNGLIGPVSAEVWEFEVSGLNLDPPMGGCC
ncbi:MAG: type ISP restriction/modification enzyme [Acidimicrobiales bacterium]